LLVAAQEDGRLVALREQRVQLELGEEIERSGVLGEEKLAEAAAVARETSAGRASSAATASTCS